MKKILLFIPVIALAACSSPEKKAHAAVVKLLDSTLNDPKSYEEVKWSALYKLKNKTITSASGKPDNIDYHGAYEISHTYRAKNAIGGVITETQIFQIDSTLTKASCCYVGQVGQ